MKTDDYINDWENCVIPGTKNREKVRSELSVLAENLNEDLVRHIHLFLDTYDKENKKECHDVGFILRKCHEVLTMLNDLGYLE